MILDIIFDKPKGFYVDVGANNPIIQSNTHYLYNKGWNGINIDAALRIILFSLNRSFLIKDIQSKT